MAVAAGSEHTVVVAEDGSVFAFGLNSDGQLGTGNSDVQHTPTRIVGLHAPVRQVAAGDFHTGIVTDAGDLFMCGCGRYGRLGLGDHNKRNTPTMVARAVFDGEAVLMVACGIYHTVVATEGGGVYTFGHGDWGQLGHGDQNRQLVPRRVPAAAFNGERVVMVAAGCWHTVALSEAGHVFTWGLGDNGRLGLGDETTELAPRQVEAWRFGGEKVVMMSAGYCHTVAVTAGGRLYTWGYNDFGQLGHVNNPGRLVPTLVGAGAFGGSAVVMAACGHSHTLVVTQDGALWACGRGNHGQLGLNNVQNRRAFERVGAFDGTKVVVAAAGREYSAVVTEDGALWTWGRGDDGQLGHGNEENRLVPTPVPRDRFGGLRIGRCRVLPREHTLAFLMGTKRQNRGTVTVKTLAGEVSLFPMIRSWCATVLPGLAGRMEGVMRLCGGFHAWRQRRGVAG